MRYCVCWVYRRCTPLTLLFLLQAITALVAGPLKPAEYFAMGEQEMEKARHYGLAIPFYTHFTSPIRRYADVMVHRLLTASLETLAEGGTTLEEYYLDSDELDMIAAHCNDKKRNADAAQDRSGAVFLCMYLKEHPMLDEPAVVTDAGGDKFIKVEVPRLGMELQVFFDRSGLVACVPAPCGYAAIALPHLSPLVCLRLLQQVLEGGEQGGPVAHARRALSRDRRLAPAHARQLRRGG